MKGIVRLLVLTCGIVATAATSVSSLPTMAPCRYSCVDRSTTPWQVYNYSFNSTEAQCCNADTTNFCGPGQNVRGLSWGNPAAKCAS
jgi:hypothetical protein